MQHLRSLIAVAVALAAAGGLYAVASAEQTPAYDAPVHLDLSFQFHIDDDIAEQDVFIEPKPGSGKIYRPTKGERDMSLPLYAAAGPVEHSPFDGNVGPWRKGRALGITLGQWLSATGRGKYTCQDGEARLTLEFVGLVPNGVYTLWHDFMAWPPTEPFTGTYDLPIGARDGTQSVFRATAGGSATVLRQFKPCLQLSGEHLLSDLSIAWHSDGETHGSVPGAFGNRTHVHMYTILPKRAGI